MDVSLLRRHITSFVEHGIDSEGKSRRLYGIDMVLIRRYDSSFASNIAF